MPGNAKTPEEEYADRRALARALPIMGDGPIPPARDLSVGDDRDSLVSISKLFLRSWPYIKPQFFGHWLATGRVEPSREETGSGYSYAYLPYLVTALSVGGLLYYDAFPDTSQRHILYPFAVYGCVIGMAAWSWIVAFCGNPPLRVSATVTMLMLAAYGNVVVAPSAMPDFAASKWIALVTGACLLGWLVQLRYRNGRVDARVRASTHLVYFFFMVYLQRLIGLATGLVLADLLFQSILQADPVIPVLANALGQGELARGVLERTLSAEERSFYQWVYVGISLALLVGQTPLRIMVGGGEYAWIMVSGSAGWYRIWILQRINQDPRTALVERWHTLSLSYHSDHRTGDSIFRIYQDSAQVTAVIDRLLDITMTIFGYLTAAFLLSLLSPRLGLIMLSVVAPILYYAKWSWTRRSARSSPSPALPARARPRSPASSRAIGSPPRARSSSMASTSPNQRLTACVDR